MRPVDSLSKADSIVYWREMMTDVCNTPGATYWWKWWWWWLWHNIFTHLQLHSHTHTCEHTHLHTHSYTHIISWRYSHTTTSTTSEIIQRSLKICDLKKSCTVIFQNEVNNEGVTIFNHPRVPRLTLHSPHLCCKSLTRAPWGHFMDEEMKFPVERIEVLSFLWIW